ncbi:MAG: hypothetical protein LKE40_04095 [Spirochaetia bacterium]|jgi:hypothetical protein|nr:hypothetical protein [Spirochaetia bacterium]
MTRRQLKKICYVSILITSVLFSLTGCKKKQQAEAEVPATQTVVQKEKIDVQPAVKEPVPVTAESTSQEKAATESVTKPQTEQTLQSDTQTAVTQQSAPEKEQKSQQFFKASVYGFQIKDGKLYLNDLLLSNSPVAQDTADATSETFVLDDGASLSAKADGTILAKLPNDITIQTDHLFQTFQTSFRTLLITDAPITSFVAKDNAYDCSYGSKLSMQDAPESLTVTFGRLSMAISAESATTYFDSMQVENSKVAAFTANTKGFVLTYTDGIKISADLDGNYTYTFSNENTVNVSSDSMEINNKATKAQLKGTFGKATADASANTITIVTNKEDTATIDMEGNIIIQKPEVPAEPTIEPVTEKEEAPIEQDKTASQEPVAAQPPKENNIPDGEDIFADMAMTTKIEAPSQWTLTADLEPDLYWQKDLGISIGGTVNVGFSYRLDKDLKTGISLGYTYGTIYDSSDDNQRMNLRAFIRKDFQLSIPIYVQASAGFIINLFSSVSATTPVVLGIETGTTFHMADKLSLLVGIGEDFMPSTDTIGNTVYGKIGVEYSL